MSYDLYFTGRKLSAEEFSAYFASRPHFKVDGPHVFYQNGDTGVYFSFDRNTDAEKIDPEAPDYDVSFNINFFRPHIFGLEAEPEIKTFVNAFGFSIHDPQTHGMGNGPYSSAGFLAGWNAGNEFGYKAILQSPKTDPASLATYPADSLEKIWKWNLDRNTVQAEFGDDVFVPRIFFLLEERNVRSCIVWGDAIPALIPHVDRILVPRKELAPRVLFQKKEDMCIIDFDAVSAVLGRFLTHDYGLPALLLPHPRPLSESVDLVRRLKPNTAKLVSISIDKVLDRELVDKYRPTH